MRPLALLVAFFIMCVGVTGIFMPDTLISVGRYVVTTTDSTPPALFESVSASC